MAALSFVPVEEMVARLERALAGSPADSTELVWLDARRSQESNGSRKRDRFELAVGLAYAWKKGALEWE